MALCTEKTYRNQVLYSIFVRNYSPEGTFDGVRRDLDRIAELGVQMIWLLPIHPIGRTARKGSLGSPYAISDYRAVNPEYGSMEDFLALVDGIHARGMKCILDVVYNHTSPDSWLARNHPEWFYHKPDGSMGNRIGDWTDIVDLDYSHRELWDYQIETLKMWAGIVDGFRCDAAPLIPLAFWKEARAAVEQVRPGCFWLAESVDPGLIAARRALRESCLSDGELYQAFDATYDYDIYSLFQGAVAGTLPPAQYAQAVNRQETCYPENYVKLRCLENHDQSRAGLILGQGRMLDNWTAFLYFQKGMTLLYAGQERGAVHLPSLFERDAVQWQDGRDLSGLLRTLAEMKQDPLFADSSYHVEAHPGDVLVARHRRGSREAVGVFSLRGTPGVVTVGLKDGAYTDVLSGGAVEVHGGQLFCTGLPVVLFVP